MLNERLDPKAIDKLAGPSWDSLRPLFSELNETLLSVSDSTTGRLTTIYIKYTSPDTSGNPYAVVWVKKASELIVGLSLPEDVEDARLGDPPKGCKYAGLTKFFTVDADHRVPDHFSAWAKQAYVFKSGDLEA